MLTDQEKDAGVEEDPEGREELDEAAEYGVKVAPGQKDYIIGPGGGKRRKKIDRKFLFKIIRVQQIRLNIFSELVEKLKEELIKEKKQTIYWNERANELVKQAHAKSAGIELVDNPVVVDRINQGAKNAK